MAEYTPVSKINYDLFKQNYDPNLSYNQQSQTIQQKYNEDLFNKYSDIASEEPKLGFFEKLGSGLESLFSAYGAEPDYVNPNLAEMLAQQNYQNTLAYSPMFDNRNRFKEDIIPERMIDAPMDLESTMAGSILDKGITNRSLIGDLPNLNYRDYLSNLFNRNKTTQPDFKNAPQDYYQPNGITTVAPQQTFQDYYSGVYEPYDPEKDDYQVRQIQGPEKKGIAKLMEVLGNIPTPLNLLRKAFEGIGPGFIGPKGSRAYGDESLFSTFGRSRTGAEFFQNMRDRKAREEAAKRGLEKQKEKARLDITRAIRDINTGGGGGIGSSYGGAASPGSKGPGGSDEMGSF